MAAYHLSRLRQEQGESLGKELRIDDYFPYEQLLATISAKISWYADFMNYLVCAILPQDLTRQQKK